MAIFKRLELWNDLAAAGGSRLAFVPDPAGITTTRDINGDDSLQVTLPCNSAVVSSVLTRRVLRAVRRDGAGVETFDEWRVADRTRSSGEDSATFRFTARSPRFDLLRGDVAKLLPTGETTHVFSTVAMTATQIIDTFALPALTAAGVTWFARGTVDPTAPLDLSFEYFTPLALLEALRDATGCELEIVRNGTTNYLIKLVTQIGAGATRPVFRLRRNLMRDQIFEHVQDQVTRCIPRGGRLPGLQEYHTIARVTLVVTNAAPGSGIISLTVADPAGSISPVGFTDEFNAWYVFRQKTGATFPIMLTIGNVLVIQSDANIAAGEYIELRVSDGQTQRVGIPREAPNEGTAALMYLVSIAGGNPKRANVADSGAAGVDFITFDGQYSDLFVTFCTQIVSDSPVTLDGANGRFLFGAALGSVLAGDLIYYMPSGAAASPPHGVSATTQSILWEVTSVDTVNKYAYVKPHYANRAREVLPTSGSVRAVIIRRGNVQQVITSSASGNSLDFAANIAGGDVGKIMIVEQWCSGTFPSFVQDPVAVSTYGIIPRPLDNPELRGESNLIRNPRLATWSNPVNPPDGWTIEPPPGGSTTEHSQNATPAFIRYGVRSWNLTVFDSGRNIVTVPTSPAFYINPVGFSDLLRTAIKVSFYLAELSADGYLGIWLKSNAPFGTQQINVLKIFSANTSAPVADNLKYAPGQWLDLTIPAVDVVARFGDYARTSGGFQLQLVGGANNPLTGGVVKVVLDSVAAYQVDYDPGTGVYVEGSFANAQLDAAHRQLKAYSRPTKEYTLKAMDLERLAGDDPIVLGGELDLRDVDLSEFATPRVIRSVVDELSPELPAQLTVGSRVETLTNQLAKGVV